MAPIDPRTGITDVQVGTQLRDAAVDPKPSDFLVPTNAGAAGALGNPHGPTVVSPEIHGSQGVRPVAPGPVSDDPDVQEAAETDHLEASIPETLGIASIAITGTQTVVAGATTQFTATGTKVGGGTTAVSALATWTSSDTTKATVDADGTVTGVAAGTSTISAAYGGVESTRTVTVSAA